VAWVLRLVEIGAEGEGPCADAVEISRPDGLVDIADVGMTPGFTHEVPEVERYACVGNCKSSLALSGATISKPRHVIAERAQLYYS